MCKKQRLKQQNHRFFFISQLKEGDLFELEGDCYKIDKNSDDDDYVTVSNLFETKKILFSKVVKKIS